MQSLGFFEVTGVVAAIDALDIMCKSASVSLVSWERKLGGRLVTLIITGDVSAVSAAIENAKAQCIKKPCATVVIANPHQETVRLTELSAQRLAKDKGGSEGASSAAAPKASAEDTSQESPVKESEHTKPQATVKEAPKASEEAKDAQRKTVKKAPARKPSAKKKRRDDEDDVWHETL